MPFCVDCGAEQPAGARFCPTCGRAVAAPSPPPASTRKVVTVLFADIVGSTTLGEEHDPEAVQAVLAEYFDTARTIVARHGGTIEKFIGDAVVAVFGVPEAHEDDALRAVRAGIEFRDAIAGLSGAAALGSLRVRVGITTGEVVVGDPTTGQSFSVGDAMNTAARLQAAAAQDQVLIGDLTRDLAGDAVAVEPVGSLTLKGKHAPVRAWAVLAVAAERTGRSRRLDTPLVGRQVEFTALQDALASVRSSGVPRLVTLLGDAGVGKKKLVHDFVTSAGIRNLHGRCLSYGDGVTFWPLVEVLRGAAGVDDTDPDAAARALRTLLSSDDAGERVTERLLEILSGGGVSNTQEVFWAVRRFLGALAETPLVLVIDDIHWAEPTFLDLLEYLTSWTHAPLLLLCTARPDLLEARPEWANATNGEVIHLRALNNDHTEELVRSLLHQSAVDPAVARRIVAASEGNPLYVEEMVRMLVDDNAGSSRLKDAQWEVPPTVQALIRARMDRLDADAQTTLQRAAVIGVEFSPDALAALAADAAAATTVGALRTLVHREFVVPQQGAHDEAYRFAHGLIQDVAYAATPKRQRATLHAAFADWLQARAHDEARVEHDEIVGHHLGEAATLRREVAVDDEETARLAARAAALLARAGRRALARSDMPAAAKLLRRAAALTRGETDRAQLELDLCDALIEMGELTEAGNLLPQIHQTAERFDDGRLRARAAVMTAMVDMNLDVQRDDVTRTFDDLVAAMRDAGDFVGCAQAHQVLADVNWNDSRFEAAQKDLETALRYAQQAGDAREQGRIVAWLASALLWGPAHVGEAVARCEQIVRDAGNDLLIEGKTLLILAGLYAFQGRFDQARQTFERSQDIIEDLGLSLTLASGTQVSGMIEMLAGDPAAAEREFRRGYDALVAMGQKGYLPAAAAFLAGALLAQERFDEAAELAAFLEASVADDDEAARGDWARIAARLAVARGDAAVAVELARSAVAAYAGTDEVKSHADALYDLACAAVAAGDITTARDAADHARRLYEMKGIAPAAAATTALLDTIAERSSRLSG